MKELTVKIPESLDLDSDEVTLFLASKLYEEGKLSLGQAADMVGLSKTTFAEMLSKFGVSIFNYPSSDLPKDFENA